jgi:hypothetical protein
MCNSKGLLKQGDTGNWLLAPGHWSIGQIMCMNARYYMANGVWLRE